MINTIIFSLIKETQTVGSRASCNLMADRRLCLTGTPVQNKLDDVYALIKFLRLEPFDDKNIWMEFIGCCTSSDDHEVHYLEVNKGVEGF
jgi:SNF2 family DNA or RNA helicase